MKLQKYSARCFVFICSTSERRFRQSSDIGLQREESTRQRPGLDRWPPELETPRSDIERLEIRPTKHAARRPLHGHADLLIDRSIGRVADHTPAIPDRHPDESLAVDRQAIRNA